MTIEEARRIMEMADGIFNYEPGDTTITLDDKFTAEELEAIAMCMREDIRLSATSERQS